MGDQRARQERYCRFHDGGLSTAISPEKRWIFEDFDQQFNAILVSSHIAALLLFKSSSSVLERAIG